MDFLSEAACRHQIESAKSFVTVKMATSTITETVPSTTENLTVPINEEPKYTKIPGGWEVEFKGYKWFTGTKPNTQYVPPEDFKVLKNTQEVPINPKGQTEMPQTLTADYSDVRLCGLVMSFRT